MSVLNVHKVVDDWYEASRFNTCYHVSLVEALRMCSVSVFSPCDLADFRTNQIVLQTRNTLADFFCVKLVSCLTQNVYSCEIHSFSIGLPQSPPSIIQSTRDDVYNVI